jgi:hypothetical protein
LSNVWNVVSLQSDFWTHGCANGLLSLILAAPYPHSIAIVQPACNSSKAAESSEAAEPT